MRDAGIPVDVSEPPTTFTLEDIGKLSIRELCSRYLLQKIAKQCRLIKALQDRIPDKRCALFVLACNLVASGDPFLCFEGSVQNMGFLPVRFMSS